MAETSRYEWLEWMDRSGPFLAEPVLAQAMPQGLELVDPLKRKRVRQAYDEWRDAVDGGDPRVDDYHSYWVDHVLRQVLDLDVDDTGKVFKSAEQRPDSMAVRFPEHGVTLTVDHAVVRDDDAPPLMLIKSYGYQVDLEKPVQGDGWASLPAERMVRHCRAVGTRLGLITNGERWMLVDAPEGSVTSFASWYSRLWSQEPVTLQAFVSLLGVSRFFTSENERLPALLDKSLEYQDEVTDALGEQVRRAVEVLIQALDRADVDRNRELLRDVEPKTLYEAGLTVMMRLVFLLSAEERDLLLLGDNRYEANYAISTLRMQLRQESDGILERRQDAWSRLLAIFRAVYGGVEHETLRLPALGGSLFDPDRFPFLEGRSVGSSWKDEPADPLPIDNRTVLLLLNAIQIFEGRTLSYRGLDIEQLGYVYEGLLDHTVVRATEATLELSATKSAKNPWATLAEVEAASEKGESELKKLLKERTASSASRIRNDLAKEATEADAERLLSACHGDHELRDRIRPYFHFLEIDQWGYPLVYPAGAFMVGKGLERRQTGSHYTPKSLTEAIVKETLEPVAYIGPAEGKPREEWALRSPEELLDLKICDPAMGSGAFLVQVCRWLGERLVESWQRAEEEGKFVSADGDVLEDASAKELLSPDTEERTVTARRLIAERCIYGVDINPLAVELGKLSIWLITLAKGRPFGFLDHNLKSGDSLLGINQLTQLTELNLEPKGAAQSRLFGQSIKSAVDEALELRKRLRDTPIRDIHDVEAMARLDFEARAKLALPEIIADAFIGAVFAGGKKGAKESKLVAIGSEADRAFKGEQESTTSLAQKATTDLATDSPSGQTRNPFHWPLEFPEVFQRENGGFDAMVGNPPFLGGTRISSAYGMTHFAWLKLVTPGAGHLCDLVAYFFRRVFQLLRQSGTFGLIATNTIRQGDTREGGLTPIRMQGGSIYAATRRLKWPGRAVVRVSVVHVRKGAVEAALLDGEPCGRITAFLFSKGGDQSPNRLFGRNDLFSAGSKIYGQGFLFDDGDEKASPLSLMRKVLTEDPRNRERILPYLGGSELNTDPAQAPNRHVIYLSDLQEESDLHEWPELAAIVRDKVKPYRDQLGSNPNNTPLKRRWWAYQAHRPTLYAALSQMQRTLACSQTSKYTTFAFLPPNIVFSQKLNVLLLEQWSAFALLQCRLHEEWALFFGSSMKDDPVYTPSDCFETFPFPENWQTDPTPEAAGKTYYEFRADLMVRNDDGLTKTYNRFHDPKNHEPDIVKLRELHAAMDRAVLDAYGWDDISTDCEFLLDYEIDEETWGDKKKPYRYRWPEAVHDEVLARLLDLNQKRYQEEVAQGLHGGERTPKPKTPQKPAAPAAAEQQGINFGDADSEAAE